MSHLSSVPFLFYPCPFTPLWFVSCTLFHSFYCSCCCFQCLLVVKLLNWGIQNSWEGIYFHYGIIMFVSITSQITFIIIDNLFFFFLHYCFLKIDPMYSWNCLTTCFFFSDGAFTAQPDVSQLLPRASFSIYFYDTFILVSPLLENIVKTHLHSVSWVSFCRTVLQRALRSL